MTCACLRCFLAEASFLPEKQGGELRPNMLRGKCKSTHRELSILEISSEEGAVERHWKSGVRSQERDRDRQSDRRLIQKGRRGLCCVRQRPLASSPSRRDRAMMLSCRKTSGAEEGSNRITPPLTQGSCLSEILSIQAHVSIMPATLLPCNSNTHYRKGSICLSSRQTICQICWRGHSVMEYN